MVWLVGVLANTEDGKALVGLVRGSSDTTTTTNNNSNNDNNNTDTTAICLLGAAFNGNGMTQCFGAGKALAQMASNHMLGRELYNNVHPYVAEELRPQRFRELRH